MENNLSSNMRPALHYTLAACLLTVYGGEVCPFIETLPLISLAAGVSGWLLVFFLIRVLMQQKVVLQAQPLRRPSLQFRLEMATYAGAGIGMVVFNMVVYDFPLGSGMKLFVGCLTLGFFAAADLALFRDYLTAEASADSDIITSFRPRFVSLTRKMAIVTMAFASATFLILTLIVLHDLHWMRLLPDVGDLTGAARGIVIEFVFVTVVLLGLTYNLIISYTRNLTLYFSRQTNVLEGVAGGHLDIQVPVSSQDEFGVIARYTNEMIDGLRLRTKELELTQDATILCLASLAETRDNETGQHIIRTQHYVRALAFHLRNHPRFAEFLDTATIELLYKSAPLHDIGKVGIPDKILLKPGRLTVDEFEIMKKHAEYGRDALVVAIKQLGENSFLQLAREIAYSHHEKWDGSGYPQGLQGDAIPISGRLMAVADVYDALISKRIYKPAFTHEKAFEIIREGAGIHFDSDIVTAFVEIEESVKQIALEHRDRSAAEQLQGK